MKCHYYSIIFFTLFSTLFFSNCTSHRYYAANAHHVPMFREKDSAKLTGNVDFGSDFVGLELQAAYAFSDKLAAMTNHLWGGGEATTTSFGVGVSTSLAKGNGYYGEYALGYFKPLTETLTFESFGGWGYGTIDNFYQGGGYSEVAFHKTFVQPAIGYNTGWAELIFSYRLGFLQFTKVRQSLIVSENDAMPLTDIANNSQAVLSEYAFTIRALFNSAKLHLQIGSSLAINRPDLLMSTANVNIGVTLEVDHLWNREKTLQRLY